MSDLISRQAVIDALEKVAELYPWRVPGDRDSYSQYNEAWQDALNRADSEIEALPSVQPERLTNDDFETIRIHLNAYKEKLCNQQRWKEAEEYQRIIDRFMAFASAQPQITHCAECRHWKHSDVRKNYCEVFDWMNTEEDFCSLAERRTDSNGGD